MMRALLSNKILISSTIVVFLLAAVGVYFVIIHPSSKPPTFAIDESKIQGWYAVPNYYSRAEAIASGYPDNQEENQGPITPINELPVTYRGLFQNADNSSSRGCFLLFDYHDTSVDIDSLHQKKINQISEYSQPEQYQGVKELSMNTPEGDVPYQLYQYKVVAPGSEPYMQGHQWAYIGLSSGYIGVTGVCPTVEDLDSTLLPLSAVSLVR